MGSSQQKAMPALREYVPIIAVCCVSFLLGILGIMLWTEQYWPPELSAGMFWGSLLLCVTGGGIFLKSGKKWRVADELDRNGLLTRGELTAFWKDVHSAGRFLRRTPTYYVLYTFELEVHSETQQQFAATQIIPYAIYQHLEVGLPLRIRFLPQNPNISRMEISPWKWEYSAQKSKKSELTDF